MSFIVRKFVPLLLIMCLGIFLSAKFAWKVFDLELEKDNISFKQESENHIRSLKESLKESLDILSSVKAFYNSSESLSREEFKRLTADFLKDHPYIQSIEWVPQVSDAQRAEFEQKARAEGVTGFSFTEKDADNTIVTARKRSEYFPIYFAEPSEGNKNLLGFDLLSDHIRREAIEKALKNGKVVTTPYIKLLQKTNEGLGMLVLQPVYEETDIPAQQAKLKGFIVGAYKINSLWEKILKENRSQAIKVAVFDVTSPLKKIFLYLDGLDLVEASNPVLEKDLLEAKFHTSYFVNFGSRVWQVVITPGKGLQSSEYWEPILILIVSTGLTMIIVFYIYLMIKREEKVTKLVEERTKNLTVINQQLNKEIAERMTIEHKMEEEKKRMQTFLNLSARREHHMIELKKEINELYRKMGQVPPYDLSFLEKSLHHDKVG